MGRHDSFKLLPLAPNPRRRGRFVALLAIAIVAAFSAGVAVQKYASGDSFAALATLSHPWNPQAAEATALASANNYPKCIGNVAQRVDCIVDGDTLWVHGVKIRVADIDAPEVSKPRCQYEAELGAKATNRFQELVNAAPFELQTWPGRDEDKYGRKLRVLVRDGQSIGNMLVSEGLARTWAGRREPWC